ncbi:hypothetical protein VNO80_15161 [Phaseolus coccineus]|uniref:Uncharacterized protein n=1 Tax=Phaseolus coccineus TaxID=3886 RepID=A0AAN9MPX1_PHACN
MKDMEVRITIRLETRLMELTPNIQKALDASLTNSIQERFRKSQEGTDDGMLPIPGICCLYLEYVAYTWNMLPIPRICCLYLGYVAYTVGLLISALCELLLDWVTSVTMDTEKLPWILKRTMRLMLTGKRGLCMFSDMGELDGRNNRVALFDGSEEGGMRASSLYSTSSHEIGEHDNEQALDGLQDRVNLLKRCSEVKATWGLMVPLRLTQSRCQGCGSQVRMFNGSPQAHLAERSRYSSIKMPV